MTLEELLSKSPDADYYLDSIKSLSPDKLARFQSIALELAKNGANDPVSWAYSEALEGIAQRARYYILREFDSAVNDVDANVEGACYFQEDASAIFNKISGIIGQAELEQFLKSYSKSLLESVILSLDDTNDDGNRVGWMLQETNAEGEPTGRAVEGLHEDWLDFEP